MPVSKAQKTARDKYDSEHYEYVSLKLRKGYKAQIKARAQNLGLSVNAYIIKAIEMYIETA